MGDDKVTDIRSAKGRKRSARQDSVVPPKWTFDRESIARLEEMNADYFILAQGRNVVVVERATGKRYHKEPFQRLALLRHGWLNMTDQRGVSGSIAAGDAFWRADVSMGITIATELTLVAEPPFEKRGDWQPPVLPVGTYNVWNDRVEAFLRPDARAMSMTLGALVADTALFWVLLGIVSGDGGALSAAHAFHRAEDDEAAWKAVRDYAATLVEALRDKHCRRVDSLREFLFGMTRQLCQTWLPRPHRYYFLIGCNGTGKSKLLELLVALFGRINCAQFKPSELGGRFNARAFLKLLCVAHEVPGFLSRKDGSGWFEDLKADTGGQTTSSEAKGIDSEETLSTAVWVFSTNHIDAVPPDRRLVALKGCDVPGRDATEQAQWLKDECGAFYTMLGSWIDRDMDTGVPGDGPAKIAAIFHRIASGELFPAFTSWDAMAPVPLTADVEAVKEALSYQAVELKVMIDEHMVPFDKDFGTLSDVQKAFTDLYPVNTALPRKIGALTKAFAALGVRRLGSGGVTKVGKKSMRLWCWRNFTLWDSESAASPKMRAEHLGVDDE